MLAAVADDARAAGSRLLFSSIGGSAFVPGAGRRLLFALAGASVRSAPGTSFRFSGRPAHLTVGAGVFMNQGVFVEANAPVVIGDGCLLGMDSMIVTSNHPLDDDGRISPQGEGSPVSIGKRVWIGARAVLLPGSVVESDCVIAAGAVVRGHCAAHGLYAGVPARRIRELPRPVAA
ncbi:acyltransferase [Kineococcus rubinsiae]|uniref:acyltransferase n=1 Tax=Kineococcus rubinsiae TaxID=2609562 RepID=UPI0014309CA1|nr:acyltransferase [Kineococcus rubinsiae]